MKKVFFSGRKLKFGFGFGLLGTHNTNNESKCVSPGNSIVEKHFSTSQQFPYFFFLLFVQYFCSSLLILDKKKKIVLCS